MKKLIYIWINNYRNIFREQGYQLSPEVLVKSTVLSPENADEVELQITLTDNRKQILPNFYGSNIASLTALVGKNGSGKTTIARMLIEYLPENYRYNNILNNSELLTRSDWDRRVLYVLYDESDATVFICPIGISVISAPCSEIEPKKLDETQIYEESCSTLQSGIYITNVFNPSDFLNPFSELEATCYKTKPQQTYSPAFLLKHEADKQVKNGYGYRFNETQFIGVIQKYAQQQINSPTSAFINKQAALFLKSYYHIPKKLKKELQVYQNFEINVVEFANEEEVMPYISQDAGNNSTNKLDSLAPDEKLLVHLKMRYLAITHNPYMQPSDILVRLYVNMLLEVYGVFYHSGNVLEGEIKDILLNPYGISEINFSILPYILKALQADTFQKCNWATQIIEFVILLLEQKDCNEHKKITLEAGIHTFDQQQNFLKWYYNEIIKETSFVKRNIIFRWKPTSSGEMAVANIFAYLDDAIMNLSNYSQNVLLIFDELDCYLHPKWQQYIANLLFERLQDYKEYRFQVIITSHSPIILSDICKDNILKLNGFNACAENVNTFGADITHLYYDSFFMNEGDIGDFAKKNIQFAINELKKGRDIEKGKLQYIIDNIGQAIVKNTLQKKLEALQYRRNYTSEIDNALKTLNSLNPEDRRKVLDMVNQLEKNQKG